MRQAGTVLTLDSNDMVAIDVGNITSESIVRLVCGTRRRIISLSLDEIRALIGFSGDHGWSVGEPRPTSRHGNAVHRKTSWTHEIQITNSTEFGSNGLSLAVESPDARLVSNVSELPSECEVILNVAQNLDIRETHGISLSAGAVSILAEMHAWLVIAQDTDLL